MNRRAAALVVGATAILALLAVVWWSTAGRPTADTPVGDEPERTGSAEVTGAELYFPNTAGWLAAESRDLIANVFTDTDLFLCSDQGLDQSISAAQQQGLSNGEIAEALVDYSVALSTTAYVDIVGVGGGNASFFRVISPAGEDYVSVCFPSEQICNSTVGESRTHLSDLDCSTRILQKRAALLASTSAQELADLARDGFKKAATGLENECYAH